MQHHAVLFDTNNNITVTIPDDRFRHYRTGYLANIDGVLLRVLCKYIDDKRKTEYTFFVPFKGFQTPEGGSGIFAAISALQSFLLRTEGVSGEDAGRLTG